MAAEKLGQGQLILLRSGGEELFGLLQGGVAPIGVKGELERFGGEAIGRGGPGIKFDDLNELLRFGFGSLRGCKQQPAGVGTVRIVF